MNEDHLYDIVGTIIDTHREAKRTRRLWRRIWAILALTIGVVAVGAWHSTAQAQTAVPAYEGAALAWDYPTNVPHHSGFRLTIQGVAGNTQIGKDVRQIPLANTTLKDQPLGKTYTLNLIAVATSPGINSAPATITIAYQARPNLVPPTNVRTILEWQP
ncbi:MAG: hypothetical protein HC888_12340 [Candidatus Competibacteraceae bacterium]|nr:hypothetical protein [Candidatus Competibacteraceae bacterium]